MPGKGMVCRFRLSWTGVTDFKTVTATLSLVVPADVLSLYADVVIGNGPGDVPLGSGNGPAAQSTSRGGGGTARMSGRWRSRSRNVLA